MDHQHGLVTGFAIDKGVDLWFDVREDSLVKLSSRTFEGDVEFHVNTPSQVKEKHWGDYARGAKYALRKRFELSHGIEGVIQGSLPVGGLSSSAAVLIAYVMAFAKANDIALQPFEVVKIADCDSNDWRIIKRNVDMPEFEIGIFFSGLTRSLVNSDYNLRVYECKTAAWNMLAYTDQPLKTFDKTFLRDIPKATFDKTRIAMPQRFARRAEHFYSEYRRVRNCLVNYRLTPVRVVSTTMSADRQSLLLFMRLCVSCQVSMVVVFLVQVSRVLASHSWIRHIRRRFRRRSQRSIWSSSLNMKKRSRCSG